MRSVRFQGVIGGTVRAPDTGMKKPKKRPQAAILHYNEARNYIEAKYKIDVRNYKGRKYTGKPDDAPYCDFWHWMLEKNGDCTNGSVIYMPFEYLNDAATEEWVKEILRLFKKEFGPRKNDLEMWVEW